MTSIEWTDETWNPTDGCLVCSPGCANCYAMRFAGRFSKPGERYHGLVTIAKNKRAIWTGEGRLSRDKLVKPLAWKHPRRIFVNSMSDLFFEKFTNEEIAAVFGVMAACPQHTFQVLTKRAKRMREWFEWIEREAATCNGGVGMTPAARCFVEAQKLDSYPTTPLRQGRVVDRALAAAWPLPNVWLGVSVENQDAADERIPELLTTPAAIRFLSCEPLIGPVTIADYFDPCAVPCGEDPWPALDWCIVGCESGPGARPAQVEWYRKIRDQCAVAGVPFFLKQAMEQRGGDAASGDAHRIAAGRGSGTKGRSVITLPYLDGEQHADFPMGHL